MNSKQFNEDMQNNYNKASKAQAVSKNIDSLVKKIASQSIATMTSSSLGQMIEEFFPLLDDVKAVEATLKDSDTFIIYQKYHGFIKQLEGQNGEIISMSNQSSQAQNNPEKMKQIQDRVVKLIMQLKQLHTEAFQQKQRYLLWMDRKECNNYGQLKELQDLYQGQVLVQYYTDDNLFRQKVKELKDFPLIIIMSACAAGSNEKYNDGKHFQFLKDNQKELRLRGVLIYCGEQGKKACSPLLKDPSRLLAGITSDPTELMSMAKSLIVSQAFKRIVPLEQLNFFLPNLKPSLMDISQHDWSGVNLFSFSPKNINYEGIFKEALNIIKEEQLEFAPEVVQNIQGIPEAIGKVFSKATTEKEISKGIANLYSKQSTIHPVYQCLNTTLNVMNEKLISKLQPFIDLFKVSFFKYDDEQNSAIKKDGKPTILYRGSTVPKDLYNDMVKLNSFVTLPSFSSFSTDREKAIGFIGFNIKYGDCVPVLLEYSFKTGSLGYANRPKCIAQDSEFPKEDEYIVYPFTMFKVKNIVPLIENDDKNFFSVITLSIS